MLPELDAGQLDGETIAAGIPDPSGRNDIIRLSVPLRARNLCTERLRLGNYRFFLPASPRDNGVPSPWCDTARSTAARSHGADACPKPARKSPLSAKQLRFASRCSRTNGLRVRCDCRNSWRPLTQRARSGAYDLRLSRQLDKYCKICRVLGYGAQKHVEDCSVSVPRTNLLY